MSLFIPFLYFIFATGLIVILTNKSFGKCLPITLMINAFSYFISQVLFNTFKVGFIINLLMVIAFIILLIVKKKQNKINDFKNNFFSKGFYAFIVIFLAVFIYDFNREFTMWDEFSHWGVMVKEMLRLDKFYSVELSSLMVHKDYPPIIQLFELFYCKLSGGYTESHVTTAIHLFGFCLFIPAICENLKFKRLETIIKSLVIVISAYLVMLLFDQHNVINTIYTDYTMAIVIAYLLSIIIFEKDTLSNFTLFNLSIGFSFLLLTKQIALPLYLMILFLFIMDLLMKNKWKINKLFNKNNIIPVIKVIILLIIVPLAFWKGWNNYVETLNVTQQFKLSDLKVSELKGIIMGTSGESWQNIAAKNYIKAVKFENVTTSYIKLSYIQCIVLVLSLLYLIWKIDNKHFYKGQLTILGMTLTFGFIGYAFVMLVMYTFSFGPREGPILASFNRYMPTYVIVCMTLLYMMLINVCESQKEEKKSLRILIATMVVLILVQAPDTLSKFYPRILKSGESDFEIHANIIRPQIEENSKLFIIAEDTPGNFQYRIKYHLDGVTTNLEYFNLETDESKIENFDEYVAGFKNYLKDYDYLYIGNLNDDFNDMYGFLFDENEVKVTNLYKVNKKDGSLTLIKQ